MDYKNKYFKYKNKYKNLKYILTGGNLDEFKHNVLNFINTNMDIIIKNNIFKKYNIRKEELEQIGEQFNILRDTIKDNIFKCENIDKTKECITICERIKKYLNREFAYFYDINSYYEIKADINLLYFSSNYVCGELKEKIENLYIQIEDFFKSSRRKFTIEEVLPFITDIYIFCGNLAKTIINIDTLNTINIYSYATGSGVFELIFTIFLRITYQNIQNINIIYFEQNIINLSSYNLFNNIINGYTDNISGYESNIFISINPQFLDYSNKDFMPIATILNKKQNIPIIIFNYDHWIDIKQQNLELCKFKEYIIKIDPEDIEEIDKKYITYINSSDLITYLKLGGYHNIHKNYYEKHYQKH